MTKKVYIYGTLCFLVAILFALSAIGKTISNDSFVLDLEWFCAMIFTIAVFCTSEENRKIPRCYC